MTYGVFQNTLILSIVVDHVQSGRVGCQAKFLRSCRRGAEGEIKLHTRCEQISGWSKRGERGPFQAFGRCGRSKGGPKPNLTPQTGRSRGVVAPRGWSF